MSRSGLTTAVLLLVALVAAACGKKGAPLAPLYLVPSPVSDVSARRVEDAIRLRFVLPAKNINGPGIDLDRVEIYAVTVEPGSETPPNRELLTKPYLAGQVQVKPPPVEGAPETTEDKRPAPGDAVTFAEQLSTLPPPPPRKVSKKPAPPDPAAATSVAPGVTPETEPISPAPGETPPSAPAAPAPSVAEVPPEAAATPAGKTMPPPATPPPTQPGAPAPAGAPAAAGTGAAQAAPAAPAPKITQPTRIYVIRGVARNGRSGPPSGRIAVPLSTTPDAPGGLKAENTEKAVVVEWLPAVVTVAGASRTYNVYKTDAPDEPLNPKPLESATFQQAGAALGTEVCFRVRAVEANGPVLIESPLSEPACVTPKDVFAPVTPKGLATVSTPGAVQLIWDANGEFDLAGYIVLRAEAPDETLQPLTPAPIRDTVFKDSSVTPGVRYLYAIVAVDSSAPPNRSAPSERVEAIAR
jgi:hypothetical protein